MTPQYIGHEPPVNPLTHANARDVLSLLHYVDKHLDQGDKLPPGVLTQAVTFVERWLATESPQLVHMGEPVHVWVRRTDSCRPAIVHRVRPHMLVDLVALDPGEGGDGPSWMRLPGVPAGTHPDTHEPYLWHRPESCRGAGGDD